MDAQKVMMQMIFLCCVVKYADWKTGKDWKMFKSAREALPPRVSERCKTTLLWLQVSLKTSPGGNHKYSNWMALREESAGQSLRHPRIRESAPPMRKTRPGLAGKVFRPRPLSVGNTPPKWAMDEAVQSDLFPILHSTDEDGRDGDPSKEKWWGKLRMPQRNGKTKRKGAFAVAHFPSALMCLLSLTHVWAHVCVKFYFALLFRGTTVHTKQHSKKLQERPQITLAHRISERTSWSCYHSCELRKISVDLSTLTVP